MIPAFSKITTRFILLFLVAGTSFFFSCQKEMSSNNNGNTILPDLSTKVNSSVTGFVTDENDAAVAGALVTAGTTTANTDKYGYFEISNASVVKDAAVVTVTRPGYFKGIKTYIAATGKMAFFRIKLIPKTIAGNVDAAAGGTVALSNGLSVAFPANAIVNNTTGAAYSGAVNVAAYWINPTGTELNKIMPGDLRGITTAGSVKMLATYGMAAVELTGASGELLQVAPGKKATLTFPIPAAILSKAPASIALWYFDEATGLWKQQGSATKTGSNYIGDVSHFSYWNCDVPFADAVNFSCTVTDFSGHPLPGVYVNVYGSDSGYTGCHGITDSTGYISGAIPANSQLILQLSGYWNCNGPSYSKTFTTTNGDIALGNIEIPAANIAVITGNVTNCANAAVTKGHVMLKSGEIFRTSVDNTGNFSFSTILCQGSADVSLIAEDDVTLQESAVVYTTVSNGNNAIGTINACGTAVPEFLTYKIDGVTTTFTASGDSLYHYENPLPPLPSDIISAYAYINNNQANTAYIEFAHAGVAANSSQNLISFRSSTVSDSLFITTPVAVTITEYGAVGEFMAGNFAGTFKGAPPINTAHTVTCNFRVRRTQ